MNSTRVRNVCDSYSLQNKQFVRVLSFESRDVRRYVKFFLEKTPRPLKTAHFNSRRLSNLEYRRHRLRHFTPLHPSAWQPIKRRPHRSSQTCPFATCYTYASSCILPAFYLYLKVLIKTRLRRILVVFCKTMVLFERN